RSWTPVDLTRVGSLFPAVFFALFRPHPLNPKPRRGKERHIMKPIIQLRTIIPSLFIGLTLLCPAAPKAFGVSPPPDGGYPGGNTAEGQNALLNRTTGGFNTAVGFFSLRSDTTGSFNTAVGAGTLLANTGDNNTATGALALFSNTTGVGSTAAGAFALISNTTGSGNTGSGYQALFLNQAGANNAAYGYTAL